MSTKGRITDGLGTGRTVSVTPANALLVQVLPDTSIGIPGALLSRYRLLSEFFLDGGGSSNQVVNGAGTPVEFSIRASVGLTKWITGFRVIIEGNEFALATNDFRRYGAIPDPGLPNGLQIEADQGGVITAIANEPVRITGDYLNYANEFTNFINAITSNAEYLQFVFRFDQPIVLTAASTDRLTIRVRDNLIAAVIAVPAARARQYALATGYQESV